MLAKLKLLARDIRTIFAEAQLPMVASSLAYTTVLSIIPVLAMSFSIFKAFGGMDKMYATIEPIVIENLAEGSGEQVMTYIRTFIGNIHAGTLGATGLIGLIVTCMSMLFSIEKSIHQIWKAPLTRPWFQRLAYYWLIITLGPLTMAFGVGFATSNATLSDVPIAAYLPSGFGVLCLAILCFFLLYKWVPSRPVHFIPALISAILAAFSWNLARIGYARYTAKALTYNKIYGSLSAVPILLLWIYIAWLVVLSGAALSASIQRRYDK